MAKTPNSPAGGKNRPPTDLSPLIPAAAALAAFAAFLFAPQVLNDGDTYWHLAAGEWMVRHLAVPTTDVFSFSRAGEPWEAHEWLAEVLMALAYLAGGWSGLLVLFGAVVASAAALLAGRLDRSLQGLGLFLTVLLAFACIAPSLLARPHVMVLPILVLWTGELLAARAEDRAPRLAFALLIALWANLHGSYVFAAVVAAPLALEALAQAPSWQERRRVLHGWGLFGLASLAAALLTPHGLAGLIFPFKLMTLSILDGIMEWKSADFSTFGPFEVVLIATLFVSLQRGVKVAPLRLLLLLFLLHMALRHERHLLILGVVGPLILAQPLADALGQARPAATGRRPRLAVAVFAAALALAGVRLALPAARVDNATTPKTALAALPAPLKALPVLNEYGFGGYLIFKGVKPYIDGRADMYGDRFVARYLKLAAPNATLLDETLKDANIQWTIFPPDHPVVGLMDAKPGWRRLYADRYAVVHIRREDTASAFAALENWRAFRKDTPAR